MAIYAAVMCPQMIGGVVGLSGDILSCLLTQLAEDKEGIFEDKKQDLPFFIYHGKEDDVVDCECAMKTYEKFISYGFQKVKLHKDEFLGHMINDQECKLFTEFLESLML